MKRSERFARGGFVVAAALFGLWSAAATAKGRPESTPKATSSNTKLERSAKPTKDETKGRTAPLPKLPVEQYQLDNGLTVLLSEDHTYPAVAVELVYLVGSSHERKGRTGFAHLFEHLMFQGSKNYNQEYFTPYEPIGADVNGTTNRDRTNFYEQVPSQYAELPLWMESDRMRTLGRVLSQAKLDNQRDVVKNERRQRYEIAPYGMDFWYMSEALFPEGHPYRHTPIGSHADLTAATLSDVRSFFDTYYVPANAGLVITGDFDPAVTKERIERYFGDIPAGKRALTPTAARPIIQTRKHWIVEDEIELPRVYYAFHTPALFEEDDAELDLLSGVLTAGKSSRLFHSLVYDQKLAKDVAAYQISMKMSGFYVIQATAAPGTDLDELATAIEKELNRALKKPPSEAELTRARNSYKKDFFQRMETYTSRASLLGSYFLFTGQGDYVERDYARYDQATSEGVVAAGKKYLDLARSVRVDFVPGKKGTPVLHLEEESNADEKSQGGAQ